MEVQAHASSVSPRSETESLGPRAIEGQGLTSRGHDLIHAAAMMARLTATCIMVDVPILCMFAGHSSTKDGKYQSS